MNNYLFYLLNILLFALPLALFEINLEKSQGWGGGFPKDKWYGKSSLKNTRLAQSLMKITKLEIPLNYHLVIMLLFLVVFVAELIITKNIFLVLSCFFGVNFFADLSWFALNWHFDSMKQLLKGPHGSISWHKSWFKISKRSYLPTTYPIWLSLSIVFFTLSFLF